jgi:hypothetical protein
MLRSPVIGCEARTMENQDSSTVTEHESNAGMVPRRTLEHRTASAVTIGGVALNGPIGPDGTTTWNWVSGIDRVGSAVRAVTAGQVGLSERVTARKSTLLTAFVLGAVVAGGGAVVLLAIGGVAPVGIGVVGLARGMPNGIFETIAVLTSTGAAVGFSLVGLAGFRTPTLSTPTSQVLPGSGVALLLPIAAVSLQAGLGITMPEWLFGSSIAVVAVDTLAVGHVPDDPSTGMVAVNA